jgi:chitooligosaccharide deacetylase
VGRVSRYRKSVKVLRSAGLERPIHAIAGALESVDTERPIFHLTYDDGPHPTVTPAVLNALDEGGAKATFFVLTEKAQRYPDLVVETMNRGHSIGLHTRTHPRLPEVSWRQLLDEVGAARRDLEQVTGQPIHWFRPPYGAEGLRSIPVVRWFKMRTMVWSVDTHDWKGLRRPDPLPQLDRRLSSGGIALLHDVPAGVSPEEDRANGYLSKDELTRIFLQRLDDKGLRPVSLSDLLAAGSPVRRAKLA